MEAEENKTEWCLLQNQFDSYEKHSLYIKLLSVVVLLLAEISSATSFVIFLVLLVLWLQDAIWKTFQSRIESRLLQLEKYIAEKNEASAFQFSSEFNRERLSGVSLISEYVHQAVRPTVAFPHVVLVLILLVQCVF